MATPFLSVLIPTRNRAELLADALRSAVDQTDGDIEVIVADNASDDDTVSVARSFADPRIRVYTSETSLDVTANWNRALTLSRGAFVIMLGDDDALLPSYTSRLRQVAGAFPEADAVYHGTWLRAAVGVDPAFPDGYMRENLGAEFLRGRTRASLLSDETRQRMVDGFLDFRLRFNFNMQFAALRRSLVERLSAAGPVFASDFPDYFTMNAVMLTADAVVAVPEALVVVGVSAKSYGFYHLNQREGEGREFLRATIDETPVGERLSELPGSYINTGWLSASLALASRLPADVPRTPSVRRYRYLQALSVYRSVYWDRLRAPDDVRVINESLAHSTRLALSLVFRTGALVGRALPSGLRDRGWNIAGGLLARQFPRWRYQSHPVGESMLQAVAWAEARCGDRDDHS